jgi:hypothetical protein
MCGIKRLWKRCALKLEQSTAIIRRRWRARSRDAGGSGTTVLAHDHPQHASLTASGVSSRGVGLYSLGSSGVSVRLGPNNKEDALKNKDASLIGKRRLMRFLMFVASEFEGKPKISGKEDETVLQVPRDGLHRKKKLAGVHPRTGRHAGGRGPGPAARSISKEALRRRTGRLQGNTRLRHRYLQCRLPSTRTKDGARHVAVPRPDLDASKEPDALLCLDAMVGMTLVRFIAIINRPTSFQALTIFYPEASSGPSFTAASIKGAPNL